MLAFLMRNAGSIADKREVKSAYNSIFPDLFTRRGSFYWNVTTKKKAAGEEYIDIEDMYGYRPVSLICTIRCPRCSEECKVDLEDYMYEQRGNEKENGMGQISCIASILGTAMSA